MKNETIESLTKERDQLQSQLTESRERLRVAEFEIKILRQFGNKDCTGMADEYLSEHKAQIQEPNGKKGG